MFLTCELQTDDADGRTDLLRIMCKKYAHVLLAGLPLTKRIWVFLFFSKFSLLFILQTILEQHGGPAEYT